MFKIQFFGKPSPQPGVAVWRRSKRNVGWNTDGRNSRGRKSLHVGGSAESVAPAAVGPDGDQRPMGARSQVESRSSKSQGQRAVRRIQQTRRRVRRGGFAFDVSHPPN